MSIVQQITAVAAREFVSWQPFQDLADWLRQYCDVHRPVVVGTITDVSGYAATGRSSVRVSIGGGEITAWWTDAPQPPTVGERVQVQLMDSLPGAGWLGFPQQATVVAAMMGSFVNVNGTGTDTFTPGYPNLGETLGLTYNGPCVLRLVNDHAADTTYYPRMWEVPDLIVGGIKVVNVPGGSAAGTEFSIDGGAAFGYCQLITMEPGTGTIGCACEVWGPY
jgi:hypothetical protein